MATGLGYDPGNCYIWRAADGFAVHLSFKVVTQITGEIWRGGTESQPVETRGILLGRTIDTPDSDTPSRSTLIEDFKLIASSEDPAAHPDSDDAAFEIASRMAEAGNGQRVVGFFRSRRDGRLNMGARDLQTFSRLFCETGNVALLIQTSTPSNESRAALFYWQQGGAYPRDYGFGFPFDAGQLVSGHPGWRYVKPFDHTEPAATPPQPGAKKPIREPRHFSASWEPIRWSRLLPTAALMVFGIGALQLAMDYNHTVAASPSVTETAPDAAVSNDQPLLGLTVTSRPHQLEIRWSRASPAILESDRGVMKITEDGITESVPFDQTQLRDGYVAYTPKTNDVSIRLEVTGKDGGTTSESLRSVAIP